MQSNDKTNPGFQNGIRVGSVKEGKVSNTLTRCASDNAVRLLVLGHYWYGTQLLGVFGSGAPLRSFYLRSGQANRSRRNTAVASDCDPGYGRGYAVAGVRSDPAK